MKKQIIVLLLVLPFIAFSNGLNLNSIGSRAGAMGGAFVGLADDMSAVFWNPAGLSQIENSSLWLYGSFIMPKGVYKLSAYGIDAETESKTYPAGGFGFLKPLTDKLYGGFFVYTPSGLGAKWNGDDLKVFSNGVAYEWESLIGMVTFSPTLSYRLSDKFFIGGSLNISYGMLNIKKPSELGQYEEDLTGFGIGATLGMLFKPSDKVSFGLTFKTPQKIKASGTVSMQYVDVLGLPNEVEGEREVTWPLWIGGGVALKPFDKLTLTFDIQYTKWSELDRIEMSYQNELWQTLFGEHSAFILNWDDTTQIRAGLEYKLTENIFIRAGYYNDPAPAPDETMNILLPSITYNVATFGIGYHNDNFGLNIGTEYIMGEEREVEPIYENAMPGTHDMDMIVFNFSLVINF